MKHLRVADKSEYAAKVAFRKDDEGDLICCSACDYPAPLSAYNDPPGPHTAFRKRPIHLFCEICASTMVSNTIVYLKSHVNDGAVLKTQAFCTNAILDQMGAFDGFGEAEVVPTDEDGNYTLEQGQ